MRYSSCIDIESNPEDCAVWWKVGGVLEHAFQGKFIVPTNFHAIGQPRGGLGHFVPPPRLARRSAYNDGNGRCEGQYVQDIFKKSIVVIGRRHHRVVFGQSKSTRRRSIAV